MLIVYTIGFAAFATRPPLEAAVELEPSVIRENFGSGLRWLLTGITHR